jgi:hypothetical protein
MADDRGAIDSGTPWGYNLTSRFIGGIELNRADPQQLAGDRVLDAHAPPQAGRWSRGKRCRENGVGSILTSEK